MQSDAKCSYREMFGRGTGSNAGFVRGLENVERLNFVFRIHALESARVS